MNLEDWTRENILSRIKCLYVKCIYIQLGLFSPLFMYAFVKEHHFYPIFILFLFHIIIRCVIEYIYQVISIHMRSRYTNECQVYNRDIITCITYTFNRAAYQFLFRKKEMIFTRYNCFKLRHFVWAIGDTLFGHTQTYKWTSTR